MVAEKHLQQRPRVHSHTLTDSPAAAQSQAGRSEIRAAPLYPRQGHLPKEPTCHTSHRLPNPTPPLTWAVSSQAPLLLLVANLAPALSLDVSTGPKPSGSHPSDEISWQREEFSTACAQTRMVVTGD